MESLERRELRVEPVGAPPAPARFRWVEGSALRELPLDPAPGGLQLVPVGAEGRDLLCALIGALDRAAGGEEAPIRQSSGAIEVTVEIPREWPRPRIPPSEALAGPSGWLPAPSPAEIDGARLAARAIATIGAEGLDLLRVYPRRRRTLASWRRRLESAQWQLEIELRERRRNAAAVAFGVPIAAALAIAGAWFHQPWLSLAGGGATLALALVSSAVQREAHALLECHRRRSQRLARLDLRRDELERRTQAASRELGHTDPWALAARLDRAEVRRFEASSRLEPTAATRRWAARLAELLGCALPDERGSWELGAPADLAGWPLAVAAPRAGSDELAVAALARVAERAESGLPAPWPIVLFEPWPEDEPVARARRLMALVRAFPDRAVVALVSHR